jgi:hypothetical protein
MLIGLTGKAGSGKDTTYETIYSLFNDVRPVIRLAFADLLKRSAVSAFSDFPDWKGTAAEIKERGTVKIEVDGKPVCEISGREFLQRYGTEAHRHVFGEDFWVDAIFPPLEPLDFGPFIQSPEIYVVTDVRYDNEAARIREYGGVIWLVERPGDDIEESDHASELGIDEGLIDYLLPNDGSLDDLKDNIAKTIIASLMEKQREEEEVNAVAENASKTYEELKKVFSE